MKLSKVQITNFRCIDDSNEFKIGDVTCLVGKNESGKTTILQALERLRPYNGENAKYDKLKDYPRKHLSDYDERHENEEAQVIRTVWTMDENDKKAVTSVFGPGCLTGNEVTVTKAYEQKGSSWTVPIDTKKALAFLVEQCGCDDAEREALQPLTDAKKAFEYIQSVGSGASPAMQALAARIQQMRGHSAYLAVIDILDARTPKFMYVANYDRMSGDVSIEKLKNDIAATKVAREDHVFQAFLEFAGTNLDEISGVNRYEDLIARVESASIKITRQIFEYWSQNRHLKVRFTVEAAKTGDPAPFNAGTVMRARIYNELHEMTVPFGERSAGFIWFFSFLVLFSQVKKKHGNVIILLDEPGLNLHAKAQADLLRYIDEKLKPNHQVIYTTHSPFMVPHDDLSSVRTVEDVVRQKAQFEFETLGTKVGGDVLSTDRDTLFPLQGALGYEITQSLFVGEHTLLVEGPSEILYFQAVSAELEARGRRGLDRRWTVCPANGIDKVQAFISLFGGNKLHIAVLMDLASGQKGQVEKLRRSNILQEGHVFTVADFCNKPEADIEDMFEPGLFAQIVNGAYGLAGDAALTTDKLAAAQVGTDRLVKKVEHLVNAVLPPEAKAFSHFPPSNWLIQNPSALKVESVDVLATLDRFEVMFTRLNSLLPR
ncbi:ATP-dependent nuclease [Azospirillum soli]|uniref:ATP-dependent nuclease n=1 Tax=Azospirillum soli TaxID=1304799 RepID=UPI001AE392F5|nr:AAA family ATPase [Azospirillum soli]MBP2312619.1 putative ATPase [Azospirillum soli]